MNITLSSINWLAAIPLGFVSLLFFGLGWRSNARFFDHGSNATQKERLRDLFLSTFDIVAMAFCLLLAISPIELWLVMIPIGLGVFIFAVPISLLGGYYQLYIVGGFMPKNAGIEIRFSVPSEKAAEKIAWYEFVPLAFMLGWLMFFLINIGIGSIGWITGNSQESNGVGTIVSITVGCITAALVTLGAFLASKTG